MNLHPHGPRRSDRPADSRGARPSGGRSGRASPTGRRRKVMKCQRCPKPATFHITDIERGKPKEFHFCDEHARQHLSPSTESPGEKAEMSSLAEKLSQGTLEAARGEPASEKLT